MRHSLKETNFIFSRLRKEIKVFCFCFCLKFHVLKESQKRKKKGTLPSDENASHFIFYPPKCVLLFLSFILSFFPPTLTLTDHSVNNIEGTISQFSLIKTPIIIKNSFQFFGEVLKPTKIVLWNFMQWVISRGLGCCESLNIFATTFFVQ